MIQVYLDEQGLLDEIKNHPDAAENLVNALEDLPIHLPELSWILDSDFYCLPYGNATISDFLFQSAPRAEIRDLLLRVQLKLTRGEYVSQPVGAGVHAIREARKGGLITPSKVMDEAWWDKNSMEIIGSSLDFCLTLRRLFLTFELSYELLPNYSEVIFPNIYFHVYPDNRMLGISLEDFEAQIFLHLSWLNDFSIAVFAKSSNDREIIGKAGAAGVDLSPESVKTRGNKAAMREREVIIGGGVIVCEWHTKFKYDVGRMHFNASGGKGIGQNVTKGRVIVGIVTRHLTT